MRVLKKRRKNHILTVFAVCGVTCTSNLPWLQPSQKMLLVLARWSIRLLDSIGRPRCFPLLVLLYLLLPRNPHRPPSSPSSSSSSTSPFPCCSPSSSFFPLLLPSSSSSFSFTSLSPPAPHPRPSSSSPPLPRPYARSLNVNGTPV